MARIPTTAIAVCAGGVIAVAAGASAMAQQAVTGADGFANPADQTPFADSFSAPDRGRTTAGPADADEAEDGLPQPDTPQAVAADVRPMGTQNRDPQVLDPLPDDLLADRGLADAAPADDDLLRGGYDPLGVRVGNMILFPAVETGVSFTDNVAQTRRNRREDLGYVVAPELRLVSDWARHSAQFTASSRHLFYDDNSDEDTDEVELRGAIRIDVTAATQVDFDSFYTLAQEQRSSADVPDGALEDPDEMSWGVRLGLTQRFNRLVAAVRGAFEREEFGDVELAGGTQSSAGRDYEDLSASLRLGYEISPALQPFVQASYSVREHDREVDGAGFRRDSTGTAVAAGVAFDFGPILSGEAAVGYVDRDFDDARLSGADGFTLDGRLIWSPSRLTTVTFAAATDLDETTVAGASAAYTQDYSLELAHSLSYHLTGTAGLSYERVNYKGSGLTEKTYAASLGLDYLVNRSLVLRTRYRHERFKSSAPGSGYDSNTLTFGVRLQR